MAVKTLESPDEALGFALALDLDRKLAHIPELRMRVSVVAERVLASDPGAVCEMLGRAMSRPPQPGGDGDRLRDALITLFTATPDEPPEIPYEMRRDLYREASQRGDEAVMRLLRSAGGGEHDEVPVRLSPELAEIPLGRRRSLAKGDDPLLLEKLALDPDPQVIANLLRNPRLREAEVVRIAALRTVPTSTLIEVARAPRWSKRTHVRVALARNPNCPLDVALQALGTLPLPELREMRGDPGLPDETRRQVLAEIERRVGD
jgi:hypothetical protein